MLHLTADIVLEIHAEAITCFGVADGIRDQAEGASRGMFVTTHEYSRDALDFAVGKPIELIHRAGVEE